MAKVDPFPTPHLIDKMKDRDVTWAEVIEIIEKPEVVYGPDRSGRQIMQKRDLSVVVGRDGGVITVLLRNDEHWTDEQARAR